MSLWLATLAALVASAGDWLMLWCAAAQRPELGLATPPGSLLWIGATLGVGAIPLYAYGFRALAQTIAVDRVAARAVVTWAGGGGAFVGASIHALTARLIADSRASGLPGADPFAAVADSGSLLVVLWGVAAVLTASASLAFALEVARGRSLLPPWIAWTNPALGSVVLALVGLALHEPLRSFVAPVAPNLAHAVCFAAASLSLRARR